MPAPQQRIGTVMSEINVVPLVDVVLVLLIIFMITAPMLQMGVDVDLPKTTTKALPAEEERVLVTLTKDQRIYIDRYEVHPDQFKDRLKSILERRVNREVFFRADQALPYGAVMSVMGQMRESGVEKLGMVTEPLEATKRP
ncbi:MAG: protein TolR [Thermodesulfobacteriota bacterium]